MGIHRRYQHWGRLRVIANTLAKHGFGYFLEYLGLWELLGPGRRAKKAPIQRLHRGERFRQVLEELGPTAVKLGQILSTRADLLPTDVVAQLEKLQDQVPPFPIDQAIQLIESELAQPLSRLFQEFVPEPLGSASIGQVHRARLLTGEEVVVKVQRPGIQQQIGTDLEILRELASLAEKHTALGEVYSLSDMADELAQVLREEVDYLVEARNGEQFRHNFRQEEAIYIPKIYWDYTTPRVLTMEYISGKKLSVLMGKETGEYSPKVVARRLAEATSKMVLFDGFFHGDLHPGNIAILPGNKIALMDFGMVGRLTQEGRKHLLDLVLGLIKHQTNRVVRALAQLGAVGAGADLANLKREIEKLREYYYHLPLNRISLSKVIYEFMELAYRYRIRLPAEFTLLAKTLASLEGVVQELDPELNLQQMAELLGSKLVMARYSPAAWGGEWLDKFNEEAQLLLELPGQVSHALQTLLENRFVLHLEHRRLLPALDRLDRIANRLALSLVLLSFSVIMAGLIVASALGADPNSFFWRLPILQIGFMVALMMISWLIFSILRTGRF